MFEIASHAADAVNLHGTSYWMDERNVNGVLPCSFEWISY